MNITEATFSAIEKLLDQPMKTVLTLHRRPDPDSIASNLVMAEVLRVKGHYVDIFSEDPVPDAFSFLQGADKIQIKTLEEVDWSSYTTFWALDMSDEKRNGMTAPYPSSLVTINIDHHGMNTNFGTHNIVEASYPSTSAILFELFKKLNVRISPAMATNLHMGLIGDTGCFKYPGSATSGFTQVFEWARQLSEIGANHSQIIQNLYSHYHIDNIKILGETLSNLEMYPDDKLVVASITEDQAQRADDAGEVKAILQGYVQSVAGTDWGIMINESEPGKTRISLRSKPGTDVSKIAEKFGGRGHPNASGIVIDRKPADEVIDDLRKAYKELSAS